MIDGIRSLKRSRKIRTFNHGPMPNRLGRMQSTTAGPRGELRFEFWVLGETLKAVRDWIMPLRQLKTQNPKLNLPPDADNKECRNPAFREQSRRFRTRIRTPENRHPRHILG
jgi:hypothetical protein